MTTAIERFESTPEGKRLLAQERLILQATERILELMQQQNVTRTELARRLGKSKSWISQLLAGEANFTLRTLADVFAALGKRAVVDVEGQGDGTSPEFSHSEMDAGRVMWRQYDWIPKYPAQSAVAQSPDTLLAG
jgi:transcriptional regulator with XRE-family HTH domain